MRTSIEKKIAIGDLHEILPESLPPEQMTNFDYMAGNDILVHISVRPFKRELVINQFVDGRWHDEQQLEISADDLGKKPIIKVGFGVDRITVSLPGGKSTRFERQVRLETISELRGSLPFAMNTIRAGVDKVSASPAPVSQPVPSLPPRLTVASDVVAAATAPVPVPRPAAALVAAPSSAAEPLKPPPATAAVKAPSPAVVKPDIPDYVQKVIAEFETVDLVPLNRSVRPLPDCWSPIVISVVKNEFDRLYDFLRHYRAAGIERFVFIDNGSSDGTVEFLRAQPDVDLYARHGSFDWRLKQGWINKAISLYGFGRWYMYVDADEHLVFDGLGKRTFRDLAKLMEKRGILRIRGFLVDMYSDAPILQSRYEPHAPLLEAYRFFDLNSYKEERYREVVSVKGGPRTRVFGRSEPKFKPEMTKYPLFKVSEGEFMANPHHIWPYHGNFDSGRLIAILHFKFLPGVINKIRTAIEEANYWDGSFEYKCYLKEIDKDRDLKLVYEGTREYTPDIDLVDLGLIEAVGWPGGVDHRELFRASCNAQRARLDSEHGLSDFRLAQRAPVTERAAV